MRKKKCTVLPILEKKKKKKKRKHVMIVNHTGIIFEYMI
jgi:hypothetical protein